LYQQNKTLSVNPSSLLPALPNTVLQNSLQKFAPNFIPVLSSWWRTNYCPLPHTLWCKWRYASWGFYLLLSSANKTIHRVTQPIEGTISHIIWL